MNILIIIFQKYMKINFGIKMNNYFFTKSIFIYQIMIKLDLHIWN